MRNRRTVSRALVQLALASGAVLAATQLGSTQRQTIRESLSGANAPVERFTTIPSGIPPTVERLLAQTDLVVMGTLGAPHGVPSSDQRDVWTEFDVLDAVELGARRSSTPRSPPRPLRVTLLGGSLLIEGLTFTSRHDALPIPEEGTRCLLLLTRSSDGYRIAGDYYGIFAVENGVLRALTAKRGFAPELRGAVAEDAGEKLGRLLK
jgi:hypothetical protein